MKCFYCEEEFVVPTTLAILFDVHDKKDHRIQIVGDYTYFDIINDDGNSLLLTLTSDSNMKYFYHHENKIEFSIKDLNKNKIDNLIKTFALLR
jgi:hypothetical protein